MGAATKLSLYALALASVFGMSFLLGGLIPDEVVQERTQPAVTSETTDMPDMPDMEEGH